MSRWFFACLWMVCACLPVAAAQGVAAPAAFVLQAGGDPATEPDLVVRTGVPRDAGVEQVHAQGSAGFAPFDPHTTYPMGPQDTLWLHLRVRSLGVTAATPWTLEFSKPFIDRIDFYVRDAQGQWASQASGLEAAHADWPVRRLNPQFTLPALPAGVHDLYLRVQLEIPMRFEVRLVPDGVTEQASQAQFLVGGVALGLLVLMAALCGVLALSYRNAVFAWYSLYVVMLFFTLASYLGIANYALWPRSPQWSGVSSIVLVLLCFAAQLQFCRAMFVARDPSVWLQRLIGLTLAFTLGAAALFVLPYNNAIMLVFGAAVAVCLLLIMVVVVRALLRRSRMAIWWVLSYVPLHVVLMLTLAESFGLASLPWLAHNAPVYAVVFEVLVLLVVLHAYGKRGHARMVRARTLENTDPITGFWAPGGFRSLVEQHWKAARRNGGDLALVYVQVNPSGAGKSLGRWSQSDAMRRCAILLRTVTAKRDTTASLDGNLLAVLMPGMSKGDALTERLSRLVALGLMTDMHDAHAPVIRFRVAAGTLRTYLGSLAELDYELMSKLRSNTPDDQRSISYVGVSENLSDEVPSDSSMEVLWDLALEASEKDSQRAELAASSR